MESKKRTEFDKIAEQLQHIRQDLFEEGKLKYPSHYTLERNAQAIMQLFEGTEIEDDDFDFWKDWKIREMDIFIADLEGELHQDYDKRLARYRGKWTKEKSKIDNLISEFHQKFDRKIKTKR